MTTSLGTYEIGDGALSVGILIVALIFCAIWSCSAVAIETSKQLIKISIFLNEQQE